MSQPESPPLDFTGKIVIDCDWSPSHNGIMCPLWDRKMGKVVWDPSRIKLHEGSMEIDRSFYEDEGPLPKESVLNSCFVPFLLKNQIIIPEEWRKYRIFFLGTVFRCEPDWNDYVLTMFWDGCWCARYSRATSGGGRENDRVAILVGE